MPLRLYRKLTFWSQAFTSGRLTFWIQVSRFGRLTFEVKLLLVWKGQIGRVKRSWPFVVSGKQDICFSTFWKGYTFWTLVLFVGEKFFLCLFFFLKRNVENRNVVIRVRDIFGFWKCLDDGNLYGCAFYWYTFCDQIWLI